MYKGELKERGFEYSNGHQTGIVRAYDDLIHSFAEEFPKSKQELEFIQKRKEFFSHFCETFGFDEEEEDS